MSVEELEKRRKILMFGIIGIILSLVLSVILWYLNVNSLIIVSIQISAVIALLIFIKMNTEFQLKWKTIIVSNILDDVFPGIKFEPEQGIDKSTTEDVNIILKKGRHKSKNHIFGKYKNVFFEQEDLQIVTNYVGRENYTYEFIGKLMVFEFEKNFKTDILIEQKHFNGLRYYDKKEFEYISVLTKDETFDYHFITYGKTEENVHNFVTNKIQHMIRDIARDLDGKIMLYFKNNKLYIGVNRYKGLYKHNIFEKIDEKKIMEKIISDIKKFVDFAVYYRTISF